MRTVYYKRYGIKEQIEGYKEFDSSTPSMVMKRNKKQGGVDRSGGQKPRSTFISISGGPYIYNSDMLFQTFSDLRPGGHPSGDLYLDI